MYDVVAIGELLIDFTTDAKSPDGYPIMAAHPGGAVANFLAPLAKYGKKAALISKVGNDAFGNMLASTVAEFGIDISGVKITDDAFTTLAFVTRDENGDREFSFARKPGADIMLSDKDIDFEKIDNTKVLHFGTVGMTADPSRTAHKRAVEHAREKGKIISFDPNLRVPLWSSLEDAKQQILWGLKMADVVKISDNEVEFLFDTDAKNGAKIIMEQYGASLVFVTLGKEGCFFMNKNGSGTVPNYDGVKTIDTTGAGDIFGGSAMYGILNTGKNPCDLGVEELTQIASFACKAASISTAKLGGISSVPDLCEIQ